MAQVSPWTWRQRGLRGQGAHSLAPEPSAVADWASLGLMASWLLLAQWIMGAIGPLHMQAAEDWVI